MVYSLLIILITQSPIELYNRGNEHFENGDFTQAIESYERALEVVRHPDLYYNLGNSYFKQGSMGKAILNYRRAFLFAPRDRDINQNLDFVRSYRVDKIRIYKNPFGVMLRRIFHLFSMFEVQILTTVLFFITMVFVSLVIVNRRTVYGYGGLVSFLLCGFFFLNWLVWVNTLHARNAVVTAVEVSALSGPGADYKEILILHDGTEVRIRELRGDYALIQLPGGMAGWVLTNTFEEIY